MGLGITLIVNDPLLVYYFFVFPLTVIVPLWLAIKFPTFRVGVGFVTFVLSIVVLYIQLTMETTLGFVVTSGFFGTVFGFCLMAWGIATRAPAEEIKAQEVARVCPKCGKNLSSFPDDIQLCPYCGNQLA